MKQKQKNQIFKQEGKEGKNCEKEKSRIRSYTDKSVHTHIDPCVNKSRYISI